MDPATTPARNAIAAPFDEPAADEGLELALNRFLGALNGVEPQIARRLREEIASRFGGRYCSETMCSLLADLINGHLAQDATTDCAGGESPA